ncbi:hypothetical protein INT44_005506 [Umbelopsis vinacea]|uniref:Uncharacterized protein n=1 Tax=Umbelopsis vinacea TaxID=44442 RepID=A0A8H7QAI7_9FUNG|nr:hypothetical protein INT44_005506 [Umbelopsis vinacea]
MLLCVLALLSLFSSFAAADGMCAPSSGSQWVMLSESTSPVFTGDTATLNQPCIFAPQIKLNTFTSNTTYSKTSNTTNIIWQVPDGIHPFDPFLSNCDSTTYCSMDTSQCVNRISRGGICESTNQCVDSVQCVSNRCNGGESTWPSQGIPTSHILAGTLSAVFAVIAALIALIILRRRQKLHQKTASSQKEIVQDTLASFEQCFESDSQHTTPSMQQRNLQMRLQQEHSVGDKGDMSSSPPPYSP